MLLWKAMRFCIVSTSFMFMGLEHHSRTHSESSAIETHKFGENINKKTFRNDISHRCSVELSCNQESLATTGANLLKGGFWKNKEGNLLFCFCLWCWSCCWKLPSCGVLCRKDGRKASWKRPWEALCRFRHSAFLLHPSALVLRGEQKNLTW